MNRAEADQELATAEEWELAVVGITLASVLLGGLAGATGVGWPGLWWHLPAGALAIVIPIGAWRTVKRRVPSVMGGN